MIVKVNKGLVLESLDQFLNDVNEAANRGTPGVHTFGDTLAKIKEDIEKSKHSMTPEQIKEANINPGDRLMNPRYNRGLQ